LLAAISFAATGLSTLAVSRLLLPLVPFGTSLPKSVVSLRAVSVSVKPANLSTFVAICLDFSPANFIAHNCWLNGTESYRLFPQQQQQQQQQQFSPNV
jgi:hypothetical protein